MRLSFRNTDKSSPEFFEAKYRSNADPWDFAHSPYELERYRIILAALSHKRYRRAFEPGCSVGVLTEQLAGICSAVEATDFSATAVKEAQQRCAHLPHVAISCQSLAEAEGAARYDLLVFSEVGYYFDLDGWAAILDRLVDALAPGSTVLGSHWLGRSEDHRLNGDQVHQVLAAHPKLGLEHAERHEGFRLDRFHRL